MQAPPAGRRRASSPNGERKQDHHEESTRVDLPGDRHTPVGRGVGVCRQRRRSSADDASHIVSNGIEGTDGHRLDDLADRRRDR